MTSRRATLPSRLYRVAGRDRADPFGYHFKVLPGRISHMGKRQGKSIKRRTVVAAMGVGAAAFAIPRSARASGKQVPAPTQPVGDLEKGRPVPQPTPEVKA